MPGDEYNKSPWREGSPRLLKAKTHSPTPFPPLFKVNCASAGRGPIRGRAGMSENPKFHNFCLKILCPMTKIDDQYPVFT